MQCVSHTSDCHGSTEYSTELHYPSAPGHHMTSHCLTDHLHLFHLLSATISVLASVCLFV